jgi:type IV pilus assembly protein PilQ
MNSMEGDTLMKLRGGLFLFLVSLVAAGSAAAASGKLLGVKTSVDAQGTTFLLRLMSPVEFTPSQVGPRLYLVDVAGVTSDQPTSSQSLQSPLVSSYRVFSYQGADDRPHMGLELTLKEEAEVRPSKVSDGLQIRIERAADQRSAAPQRAPQQIASHSAPAPAPALANAPAAKPAGSSKVILREVSVVQPENSSGLEVEILADGELTYRTTKLRNPDRLVLDLPNTVNRIKQTHLNVNTSPLKAVRIGQFRNDPPISRVVMDLDSQVPFQVRNQSGVLVVALSSSGPAAAAPKSAEAATPVAAIEPKAVPSKPVVRNAAPVVKPEPVADQKVESASQPDEPVLIASNDPPSMVAPVSLVGAPMRRSEEAAARTLAAPVAPAPVYAIAKPELAPVVPQTPQSAAEAMPAAPVLMAQARPATPTMATASAQVQAQSCISGSFTGEPISLNLKDVDLKDFFRLMHEVSGLNVVLDPGVSGVLTIVLDEVPWDQAMDIVDKNNQLDCVRMGNVVRIAKIATLTKEANDQLARAKAEEDRQKQGTPLETVTRSLGYAKASDLVTPLKRFLSARGDIVPDVRTNMLIITDIPDAIEKIDRLIGTLDRKTPQVEIEARIVAATRSFARDIGVQLAASGASGNVVLGGAGIVGESPISRGTTPPLFSSSGAPPTDPTTFANLAQPLSVNFGAVGATSGLSLVLTAGRNFALDEIITAAEARGLGKLLSRPKIITQNNVEGNVEQGVKIPLQTSINNTISIVYQKVTLRLTVTPQITSEGTIFLKTDIENTTIDQGIPRILGVPALDTQLATTQVLVTDGGTVFFGGVIQTENSLTEQEVPLLGSIPLVGHLFKRKATSTSTKELLFFITPKIVQS